MPHALLSWYINNHLKEADRNCFKGRDHIFIFNKAVTNCKEIWNIPILPISSVTFASESYRPPYGATIVKTLTKNPCMMQLHVLDVCCKWYACENTFKCLKNEKEKEKNLTLVKLIKPPPSGRVLIEA